MTTDLGKGTYGGSDNWGGNFTIFRTLTAPANLKVVKLSMQYSIFGIDTAEPYRMAIYADNAGVPGTLLGYSAEKTGVAISTSNLGSGNAQTDFPIAFNAAAGSISEVDITTGTVFWVAVITNNHNGGFDLGDDSVSPGIRYYANGGANTLPDNPASTTSSNGSHSMIWVQYNPGPVSYNLTAAVGAFVLTGIGATLTISSHAYALTAAVGTFIFTGIAAKLSHAYKLAVAVGAFVLTGIAAVLRLGLIGGVGSFLLSGFGVKLARRYRPFDRGVVPIPPARTDEATLRVTRVDQPVLRK